MLAVLSFLARLLVVVQPRPLQAAVPRVLTTWALQGGLDLECLKAVQLEPST
jgi:hypothetical protein